MSALNRIKNQSIFKNWDPRGRFLRFLQKPMYDILGVKVEVEDVAFQASLLQLNELDVLDKEYTDGIRWVLGKMNDFQKLITQEISNTNVGERHETIAENFNSILDDAVKMRERAESGKGKGFIEKVLSRFKKIQTGSVVARFHEMESNMEAIFKDMETQITAEKKIFDLYEGFSIHLDEARQVSEALALAAQERYDEYHEKLKQAQQKVDEAVEAGKDTLDVGALELERNAAQRELDAEQRRVEVALSLRTNLINAQNSSNAIVAQNKQTTAAKEALHRSSTLFYSTNKQTMAQLITSINSIKGAHELTAAHNATIAGMNRAMDIQSKIGTKTQENALKAAYRTDIFDENKIKALLNNTAEFNKKRSQMFRDFIKNSEESYQSSIKLKQEFDQAIALSSSPTESDEQVDNNISLNGSRIREKLEEKRPARKKAATISTGPN